jgi:aminoglycoside phosphotransferase (APT) family kinase protein
MDESRLAAWVAEAAGHPVVALERVGYGASRATYLVDAGTVPLVARVDTGDGPMAGTELSLGREAVAYRALVSTGVRIPRLLAESPDGTALLVERATGTHELAGLDSATRSAIYDDYVDAVAELHRVDAAGLHLPGYRHPADGPSHAREELALWGRILHERTTSPWPLAHLALAVLHRCAPATVERTVFCHGDVGPGNFLHDGRRVTALLDWEFPHLGDPMDDLAWWVFRGHDVAGGCGDLGAQLARWSDATGLPVDAARIEYYRAVVMLRWLVSVASALDNGGGGMDRSVYFALVPLLAVRLTRALAGLLDLDLPPAPETPDPTPTTTAGVLDALTADLRTVVGPAATTGEAQRRLGAAELYLSHLRAADAVGPAVRAAASDDAAALTGRRPSDEADALRAVAALVHDGEARWPDLVVWSWREAHRQVALWPIVAGRALADATPIPTQ